MSAQHVVLAAIFAILFVVPLAWLFLVDRARPAAGPDQPDHDAEPLAAARVPPQGD